VLPAGAAAKGYLALTPYPAGSDFEIHKRLKQYILDQGKSDLKDLRNFGSVYYNSGLVNAAVAVEAIRAGQAKFGHRPLTGEEGRWGLEHLHIDDARLRAMGYLGLMQNLTLSCSDHEGGGAARVQQWDGSQWTLVSDWIAADRALLRPLIDEKSAAFAKEKNIVPRDCSHDQ
jgi:branched-chain amino acid transport system substrate-binding protein